VDGKLVDSPVPRAMFGVEMARRAALQSLAAKADNPRALGALAMAQAEGRLLINGLSEEHAKAMNEKLPAMNEELRLCGSGAIVHGLHMAIEMGDSRLACELIKEAADTTTPGDSHSAISLAEAAMKSMNREVRLSGAAAAAFICHKAAGREDIAKLLAEAVGERVQRIAVVIDENSERSHSLKSSFEGARWYAAASDSGISGLARIRRFPGCDVILISDSLKDITAEELITELRTDDRTKNVPIFALSTDKNVEGAKARFGDKVKGVLAKFDGAAMDAAVEGSKLNSERMRAEELASLAAMGLAHAAEIADGARADVLAACADAAGGRADTVRVPAIEVLGRFGGDAQQGALAGVLKSENASSVAKATAAMALSSLGARGVALNAETMNALEAALSDADAGVRSSAATAIGRAPNLDAAARAALIARKQMPLTVGAGAPAGGGSN
jgi:CheY-like chemotaxis protein